VLRLGSFNTEVKGKKYKQREKLGNYPSLGVVEATKRAKELSTKIYNGEDPQQTEKAEILKMQLGEVIISYYQQELTTVNQYAPSNIKGIKAKFGPWIFRNTYDKDILNRLVRCKDLQYKKLSSITPKMFKDLYQTCGERSLITANRLQEYLRKFWNDFVKEDDNPFIMKKKYKFTENVYLDFLDPIELKRVMNVLVQIDQRTGRLNYSYYKQKQLNPVTCFIACLFCWLHDEDVKKQYYLNKLLY
jgi:hypothetical protein